MGFKMIAGRWLLIVGFVLMALPAFACYPACKGAILEGDSLKNTSNNQDEKLDEILNKTVEENNINSNTKMKIVPLENWNESFENKPEKN